MKLSETLLYDYTKKILGFAYEKTGNSCEAEDLAQEIMLQLIDCIKSGREIEHISSFIYTVCCYTWSKYLRSNKRYWDYADIEEARYVADIVNIEQEAENNILGDSLRKAISQLAKIQREIILMHYYENKTTKEISRILGINDSTIRWYLGNIRRDLKEKITMSEQNLNMRPQSMIVGMDGWIEDVSNFRPLQSDLLVQNIAIVCYNAPLSVSEISQKLNVAAAYLEAHLEQMVYMDFLKKNGQKYQTNFFIKTNKAQMEELRYGYQNAGIYAEKLYDAVMARKEDFCSVSYFNKEDIREENLLWHILLKIAHELSCEQLERKWKESGLEEPIRKDGSTYWVIANMNVDRPDIPEEMKKYCKSRVCYGYKQNENSFGTVYQADTALSDRYDMTCSRTITENNTLLKFMHVILSIRDKKELTEYEKLLIAEFVKDGYIIMKKDAMKQERPVINIPIFTENEMKQIQKIIDEIKDMLGHDFLKNYIEGFAAVMEPLIPSYLDKNLRNYHKYAVMGGIDLFAHLIKQAGEGGKCSLKLPDKDEAKYICTLVVLK
ncbi:MAG: sigma-70 family RNA polymerase sigma factor [Lachnospiraceae bacterium]|nr:sigma-70 family RNA polymerase sigma factor [Lachnospiraceae bacterium]MCI8825317.1 sigma-70 family RNA polymerase sigma factor [Lachnospiraceae bacterium]